MPSSMKLKQAVRVSVCPGLEPDLSTLGLILPQQIIMTSNTSRNSAQHYDAEGNLGEVPHELLQHIGNVDYLTFHTVRRAQSPASVQMRTRHLRPPLGRFARVVRGPFRT